MAEMSCGRAMELSDYIMKFPAYWRGIFAPLSRDHSPVIKAQTWLLENREGAQTLHHSMGTTSRHCNQADWVGFLIALCEVEPVEHNNCLIFLPRILLFPVHIQRNTFAFLSEHLSEVPVSYFDKLLQLLMNYEINDEWIKLYLRKIQDYVCWKQCQHLGTGFCADDPRAQLTTASWITFTNVCQHIRDAEKSCNRDAASNKLQFDWIPETLMTNQRDCKHRGYFASEGVTLEKRKMTSQHDQIEGVEGSPAKRRKAEEEGRITPDVIIIDLDSNSPMEVGVADQEKRESFRSQRIATEEDLRPPDREMEDDRGSAYHLHDNRDVVIDADTMGTLTAMKSLLSDPSEAETLPPDQLRLLIGCPSHHLEAYCDVLELDSIPDVSLNALAHQLTGFSLELSHLSAVVLARRCFLKQILALNQTAPRTLISAVVSLSKVFPKPMIEGALIPALTQEGHYGGEATQQCNLVAKVVKEALTSEERVHLLGKIFSVARLQWSEDLSAFLIKVFACKLELNAESLDDFLVALEHHGSSQMSCAKFAKLLLDIVNRFSKQISRTSLAALQRLADANQTMLKKTLTAALERIKN